MVPWLHRHRRGHRRDPGRAGAARSAPSATCHGQRRRRPASRTTPRYDDAPSRPPCPRRRRVDHAADDRRDDDRDVRRLVRVHACGPAPTSDDSSPPPPTRPPKPAPLPSTPRRSAASGARQLDPDARRAAGARQPRRTRHRGHCSPTTRSTPPPTRSSSFSRARSTSGCCASSTSTTARSRSTSPPSAYPRGGPMSPPSDSLAAAVARRPGARRGWRAATTTPPTRRRPRRPRRSPQPSDVDHDEPRRRRPTTTTTSPPTTTTSHHDHDAPPPTTPTTIAPDDWPAILEELSRRRVALYAAPDLARIGEYCVPDTDCAGQLAGPARRLHRRGAAHRRAAAVRRRRDREGARGEPSPAGELVTIVFVVGPTALPPARIVDANGNVVDELSVTTTNTRGLVHPRQVGRPDAAVAARPGRRPRAGLVMRRLLVAVAGRDR